MADTKTAGKMTDEQRTWTLAFLNKDKQPGGGDAQAATQAATQADASQLSGGPPPAAKPPAAKPPAAQQAVQPATMPASAPQGIAPSGMKDEEIAAAIMDQQVAILINWDTALDQFQTAMTSSADAEATPDYQKVVGEYFAEKVMGAMLSKAPAASELAAFVGAIAGETKRAAAASASATLRDFIIAHKKAVGRTHSAVVAQRQSFLSAVRDRREKIEAPRPTPPLKPGQKPPKKGEAILLEPTKEDDDYAMMRMELMDLLDDLTARVKQSTSEALFRILTEEWVGNAKTVGGMGIKFPANVVITLDPGYRITKAHIQGTGGQKIAEQLLKDSPDGVDVLGLKTRRVISLMAKNGWPSAQLTLDANGRDISSGSIAEGDSTGLYKYITSNGLPPTKLLTGD